jgi:hypothetical protein
MGVRCFERWVCSKPQEKGDKCDNEMLNWVEA